MFTVVDGVVLKSLRYPDADRIVAVNTKFTDTGRSIWRTANGDVQDLRADTDAFEAYSFYTGSTGDMGVRVAKTSEFVGAYLVDFNFFHVFSIAPLFGRTVTAPEAARRAG